MAVERSRLHHKRDRLRQLRAFCEAARSRNITEAARRLGLSQPAVSLHVRELELELEALLFEREGSHIALTAAGERFHQLAAPLVEAMDELPSILSEEAAEEISGRLHIAGGPGAIVFALPRLLRPFREAYPEVRLSLTNVRRDRALELVAAGEAELAVGREEDSLDEFAFCPAFPYELVLITPPDHPLAGRESVAIPEVAEWPAIVPPRETHARKVGESIARRFGVEIEVAVEVRGWGVIKDYVEAGLGISIVPDLCLSDSDRVSVVRLDGGFEVQHLGFLYRRDRPLAPLAERFLRMVAPDFAFESAEASGPGHGRRAPGP